MRTANDPVLILSVADAQGNVTEDPLFVAVKLTGDLCSRLKLAAELCKRHRLSQICFHHEGPPPFWDVGLESPIAGFLPEWMEWSVAGEHADISLWARLPFADGGYSKISRLASSWVVDIDELEALRERGSDDDYRGLIFATHEEWCADDRFEVEVLARMAQLRRSGKWGAAK